MFVLIITKLNLKIMRLSPINENTEVMPTEVLTKKQQQHISLVMVYHES